MCVVPCVDMAMGGGGQWIATGRQTNKSNSYLDH